MPTNMQTALAVLGGILVLLGLLRTPFQIFGAKLGVVKNPKARWIALSLGILVLAGLPHKWDSKVSSQPGFAVNVTANPTINNIIVAQGSTPPSQRPSRLPVFGGSERKAGSVSVSGDVAAGSGREGPGGDARIEGGAGRHGASGGDVMIGPGTYRAGDGGPGGKGGNLIIRGGDAE